MWSKTLLLLDFQALPLSSNVSHSLKTPHLIDITTYGNGKPVLISSFYNWKKIEVWANFKTCLRFQGEFVMDYNKTQFINPLICASQEIYGENSEAEVDYPYGKLPVYTEITHHLRQVLLCDSQTTGQWLAPSGHSGRIIFRKLLISLILLLFEALLLL